MDINVTAPGAIIALGLIYLKSNNEYVWLVSVSSLLHMRMHVFIYCNFIPSENVYCRIKSYLRIVASWLSAPETPVLAEFVRPDFLMLKVSQY